MKARNYKIAFPSAAKIISLIIFIFSASSLYAQKTGIEKSKHAINSAKEYLVNKYFIRKIMISISG